MWNIDFSTRELQNMRNLTTGPVLESNGMHVIFQKKGKKMFKKGKTFGNLSKNVQNLKIF